MTTFQVIRLSADQVQHSDSAADVQNQLLQDWVLWQRGRGMSDKTITDRLTVIRRIPDAAFLTPQGVDRFLVSTGWARSTRANYHGAIRAWCKWLILTGRRSDDPTTIATTPKVKKGRPRPVADAHLAMLLETRMYRRTRAMILLAAYAGLRVSEIAAIKGDDVDTVINTITVTGKGDKQRQIPLHPILKDLAAAMPRRGWSFPTYVGNTKHLSGGPMLGNSVSSSISNVMDRAGIPGTPHALRHWFGTALREAGVDSLVIKELMGHESLATTAIYVDVPLRQRTAAVDQLPNMTTGWARSSSADERSQLSLFD
jgi:integrase/recombinase XerD